MNCYFCHQLMSCKVTEKATDTVPTWLFYECKKCNAHYEYSCERDVICIYSFEINNLRASFFPLSPKFYLDKKKNKSYEELLTLSFIPNITPDNLLRKYKTLVTFS